MSAESEAGYEEARRLVAELREQVRDLESGPREALAASLNAIDAIWRGIKADGEARMIRVWRFADAPEALRRLSTHGGDEDWLAWVPPTLQSVYVPWLETGPFGVCDISEHVLPDGSTIHIGAHA